MRKYQLECKGCGHTWYPNAKIWDRSGQEIDCPNEKFKYYGKGFRELNQPSIWKIIKTIK